MELKEAVQVCFHKYTDFNGRASRPEMWYFMLFSLGAHLLASFLDILLFGRALTDIGPLYTLTFLALILPTLAVNVRRLHDTDRSGWWLLLYFLPLVGAILLIVWWCQPANPSSRYSVGTTNIDTTSKSRDQQSKQADLARIEQLHALHERGALTAEEFASEKAKLLEVRD